MSSSETLSNYDAGHLIVGWYKQETWASSLPGSSFASLGKSGILLDYLNNGTNGDLMPPSVLASVDLWTKPLPSDSDEVVATKAANKALIIELATENREWQNTGGIIGRIPESANPFREKATLTSSDQWQAYLERAAMTTETVEMEKNPCYFFSSVLPDNKYIVLPVVPDSISDATSANWSSQSIPGRGAPIAAYGDTGARSVSFSFDLSRDPDENAYSGGFKEDNTLYDDNTPRIDSVINALRATVYPLYDNQAGLVPPITTFCFYDFRTTGYVNSVNFDWKRPILRHVAYNRPTAFGVVSVSVSMTEVVAGVPSAQFSGTPSRPFITSMKSLFGGR